MNRSAHRRALDVVRARVASVALVSWAGWACAPTVTPSEPSVAEAKTAEPSLDKEPERARRLVEQEGAILLDVRTPEEFEDGHLPGAINIPHDEVPERIDEIDARVKSRDAPVVVYCRSGRRASQAQQSLQQQGFSQVVNLGGLSDW